MRYRALSPTGDYTFGSGQQNFLINTPAAVAQVVTTTLRLWFQEWYLNLNDGTPWLEGVLGYHSQEMADMTIINQISNCQGVTGVTNFKSTQDPVTRAYTSVSGMLQTVYGETPIGISDLGDF